MGTAAHIAKIGPGGCCAGVNTRAPHGLEEGNIFLSSFTLPHDTNTTTPAIPTYESALSDWKEVCEKRAARDKNKYHRVCSILLNAPHRILNCPL